jgi:hypothetical protein
VINWLGLLIFFALLGTLTAIAVLRRGHRPLDSGVASAGITRVVAALYTLGAAIGTVVVVFQDFLSESVSVLMPVSQFWPSLPATVQVHGVSAHVVGGGFSTAQVDVTGLDGAARIWLAAGALAQGSMAALVGVAVVILCTGVIRQNPFRPALTRGINLSAIAVMAGGLGWQICTAVAGGLVSTQVLAANGWELHESKANWTDIHQLIGLPENGQQWSVDLWPVWVGLSLFAVSAVIRYGQRLQKETDGLI